MKRTYTVLVPTADPALWFPIAHCEEPEAAAEVVRVLLAYGDMREIRVEAVPVHPPPF